jgi:hypothetical protein
LGGSRRQLAPVHVSGEEPQGGQSGDGEYQCSFHFELIWLMETVKK